MPTRLTKAGWWYLGAAALTSAAAYHSASNVLFLALAFFLSALLLNGLISWWNFSKLEFRHLRIQRIRAGEIGSIQFDLFDGKRAMHSLGITAVAEIRHSRQTTSSRLKQLIRFHGGSDRKTTVSVPWTPSERGWHHAHLKQIESYFPFGLLLKVFHQKLSVEILVWPARMDREHASCIRSATLQHASTASSRVVRHRLMGQSDEVAGLRNYQHGDPMRSFNWKKTAQQRRPMVIEQKTPLVQNPDLVRFDFSSHFFPSETQLHRYCSCIASWIEWEWNEQRWVKIGLHHQPPVLIRSEASYCRVMDLLAVIEPQRKPLIASEEASAGLILTPLELLRIN